jgi:glycosyltransferase involved in cell wall biosynthesis
MNTQPRISIIMPNFNGSAYLSSAIESVLEQSFNDFELIIIDDGSNDNSWEIICKYSKKDKRITPHRNISNLKICKTLNY